MANDNVLANKISLFNLGAKAPKQIVRYNFRFSIWEPEVPKRIVKSGVWLMTIRFGLATTAEWRKSTRTYQPSEQQQATSIRAAPSAFTSPFGIHRLRQPTSTTSSLFGICLDLGSHPPPTYELLPSAFNREPAPPNSKQT